MFINSLLIEFNVKDDIASMKKFLQQDVSILKNLETNDICFNELKFILSKFLSKHKTKAKNVTFLEFFNDVFSPQNLGVTTSKFPNYTQERQEMWTESPAVLVNSKAIEELNKMLKAG